LSGALAVAAAPAGAAVTGMGGPATARHATALASASTGSAPSITTGTSLGFLYDAVGGACLGITGGNDDAPAELWNCLSGHKDQQWHVGSAYGDGYHQIVNGDGECLGVAGGSHAAGAQVVGWNCLGTSHGDQYWSISVSSCDGFGDFSLVNLATDTSLGVPYVLGTKGGVTTPGTPAVQWPWQNDTCNNQNWYGSNYP
jgi:hypothetical protein